MVHIPDMGSELKLMKKIFWDCEKRIIAQNYYDEVFDWLENNGFNDTRTRLYESYQGEPCVYPEPDAPPPPAPEGFCDEDEW